MIMELFAVLLGLIVVTLVLSVVSYRSWSQKSKENKNDAQRSKIIEEYSKAKEIPATFYLLSVDDLARLEDKFVPEPNSGCWIWIGGKAANGRNGGYSVRGKCELAHRVMYYLYKGTIPAGTEIDHKCMNTMCVNPDHLEAVTRSENIRRRNTRNKKKK